MKKAELAEIVILREDGEAVIAREVPDCRIRLRVKTGGIHMRANRKSGIELRGQSIAEILVEEQLHAAEPLAKRRSRAAAKARHACMCSGLSAEKSVRICCSVMPLARYSRTSATVIPRSLDARLTAAHFRRNCDVVFEFHRFK